MELGLPEAYPFTHSEQDGWCCPCGAKERKPKLKMGAVAITAHLTVMTRSWWEQSVKVTIIVCMVCGREAKTSKAHNIIDITNTLERK